MTHALILRFLRLPLIASLCFAAATVVSEPFHKTDVEDSTDQHSQLDADHTVPVATLPTINPVDSDVSDSNGDGEANWAADESPTLAETEADVVDAAHADSVGSAAATICAETEMEPESTERRVSEAQVLSQANSALKATLPKSELWSGVGSVIAANPGRKLDLHKTFAALAVRASEGSDSADRGSQHGESGTEITSSDITRQVIVSNAQDSRYSVSFLLGDQVQTLKPGESTSVQGTSVHIRFDRGRGTGIYEKTLGPGSYQFVVQKSGWSLLPTASASE